MSRAARVARVLNPEGEPPEDVAAAVDARPTQALSLEEPSP